MDGADGGSIITTNISNTSSAATANNNNNSTNNSMNNNEDNIRSNNNRISDEEMVWDGLSDSFSRVQVILDENRALIGEINQNQESRAPENLTRNVNLIRELNTNIAQVADIYSDMSSSFMHGVDTHSKSANVADNRNSLSNKHDKNHQKAEVKAGSKTGQKRARPK